MTDARFVISGEKAQLPNGRVIVRGTRTSSGGVTGNTCSSKWNARRKKPT